MTLYLPNPRTIKSYTEHDSDSLDWHTEWDHVRQEPSHRFCYANGKYHAEDEFFESQTEAIAVAAQMRIDMLTRLEKSFARLDHIRHRAEKES